MVSTLGLVITIFFIFAVSAQVPYKKCKVLYEGNYICNGSIITDGYVRVKASNIIDLDDDKLSVDIDGTISDVLALTYNQQFDPETGEYDQAVMILDFVEGLDKFVGTYWSYSIHHCNCNLNRNSH